MTCRRVRLRRQLQPGLDQRWQGEPGQTRRISATTWTTRARPSRGARGNLTRGSTLPRSRGQPAGDPLPVRLEGQPRSRRCLPGGGERANGGLLGPTCRRGEQPLRHRPGLRRQPDEGSSAVTGRYTDPELGQQTAVTKYEYTDAANPADHEGHPSQGEHRSSPDSAYATTMAYFTRGSKAGLLYSVTEP